MLCPGEALGREAFKLGPLESETEGAPRGDGWRRGAGGSRGLPPSVRQCVTVPSCCCSLWVTPAWERGGGQPLHPPNLSPALTRPSLCVLFTAAQGNKKEKEREENSTKGNAPPRLPTGGVGAK